MDLESFTLWPPVTTQVTTCGQPLLAQSVEGNDTPPFYFLRRSPQIDRAFFFEDVEHAFFPQALGPGEYPSGPFLS
ncbi:MAG: hypothetical protein JNK87_22575 [Bryobacterales bacterium]|nr:hypothetical protein [Bryobacterales bacterium]